MLGDQRVDLSDDLGIAAESELGVDQLLDRADPQLAQPRGLALGERLVGEIAEHGPPPQRQRTLERRGRALGPARRKLGPALDDEPFEAVGVEALAIQPQLIAVVTRHDVGARAVAVRQRLAQAWTWTCRVLAAVAGGRWPHSSSIRRSLLSVSFACSSNSASSACCLLPLTVTMRPSSTTSSDPRM